MSLIAHVMSELVTRYIILTVIYCLSADPRLRDLNLETGSRPRNNAMRRSFCAVLRPLPELAGASRVLHRATGTKYDLCLSSFSDRGVVSSMASFRDNEPSVLGRPPSPHLVSSYPRPASLASRPLRVGAPNRSKCTYVLLTCRSIDMCVWPMGETGPFKMPRRYLSASHPISPTSRAIRIGAPWWRW